MAQSISIRGTKAGPGATQINNVNYSTSYTNDDIDRACLRALRCPDSLAVKTRLKESKDKLLHKSFEWILNDPAYLNWQNGTDVQLLWIRGGAGKGKTMMSIGLIESLLEQRSTDSSLITYFFCQNADSELNTVESILKGLMLQLIKQQKDLTQPLRDRWDTTSQKFTEDVTSWRGLWDVLMEMLDRCSHSQLYVFVDALDECEGTGMTDLLRTLVRTALNRYGRTKWLVTSRPLDSAERELLGASDQVLVSLELNAEHISQAVKMYINHKVDELDRRKKYRATRQTIQTKLEEKAENTFLWVSLVCKRLEDVSRSEALTAIEDLPPGLHPFYDRILRQISKGESDEVHGCMRLLKSMILAFRPLDVLELTSVTGLTAEEGMMEDLIERCASFVKLRGDELEFVHQSARDYLAGAQGQAILDSHKTYGHSDIAHACLSHLSEHLKHNILGLSGPDWRGDKVHGFLFVLPEHLKQEILRSPNPDFTKHDVDILKGLGYAAAFWVRHLHTAKNTGIVCHDLLGGGLVDRFLFDKFLEWLECLSLLNQLPSIIGALMSLSEIFSHKTTPQDSSLAFVLDATRFVQQHYPILSTWPLQIYSSAILFSPESSIVKTKNLKHHPCWLRKAPKMRAEWSPLVRSLAEPNRPFRAVAFSLDGKWIASASSDRTIKLWNFRTGVVEEVFSGHSFSILAVAFSEDGKRIMSASVDRMIKLWDISEIGMEATTLKFHGKRVVTAASFSADGEHVVLGGRDGTVELWDVRTEHKTMLFGQTDDIYSLAFSQDGQYVVSGSVEGTIKSWDAKSGKEETSLTGHKSCVQSVAFSPDGSRIASGSWDYRIKLWDTTTGEETRTLVGHTGWVGAVVFSPDGRWIVSGSNDNTIKVWDVNTGEERRTLVGHNGWIVSVVFSPDGRWIVSGSNDGTIKVWDATLAGKQGLMDRTQPIPAVAFSSDWELLVSEHKDGELRVWDIPWEEDTRTLTSHDTPKLTVALSLDGTWSGSKSGDTPILSSDVNGLGQRTLMQILMDEHESNRSVLVSPDRTWRAVASSNKIMVLNRWTREEARSLVTPQSQVVAMTFSADGHKLAAGFEDGTINVYDLRTGDIEASVLNRLRSVDEVGFSTDGLWVMSAAASGTMIDVWNTPTKNSTTATTRSSSSAPAFVLQFTGIARPIEMHEGSSYVASVSKDGADPHLDVTHQRICLDKQPFLQLPTDMKVNYHHAKGDRLVVWTEDGQVLLFQINRQLLASELK